MPSASGQILKFELSLSSFNANLEKFRAECSDEVHAVLVTGAAAYATSMAKHSPPSLGKSTIDPQFYTDGVWYRQNDRSPLKGKRPVYDLLALVRNSQSRFRPYYGHLVREGFLYMVKIMREKKHVKTIFCRSLADAQKYARESYRGLTRAAWGIQFASTGGRVPPAFRKLTAERPDILRKASLNSATLDKNTDTVTLVNSAIASGDYLKTADTNASIAAVRSMDDRMKKIIKKKVNL